MMKRGSHRERWPGEMSQGYATLSPLQTTSRLASLADLFFSPTPIFFSFFPQRRAWSQANTKPSLWVPITGTSTRFDYYLGMHP